MNVLVTGGAGFIGSHVTDAYVEAGHRVWVIDDESSGRRSQVNKRARYERLNVCDAAKVERLFKKVRFDVVSHHAAQIDVRKSVADPHHDARVNVFGLLNVLKSCCERGVKKILFSASGGTVYGECKRAATESFPEVPLSPYGITKLAGEKYIQSYGALHGLKYTIFRYANVYGPRQDPHGEAGVVAIFSQRLLKGEPVTIYGNGRQTRDFVYVGDVARANLLAATRANNEIVNIGTSRETSVNELFSVMADITGFTGPAKRAQARPGELLRSFVDVSKARRVLKWRPETPLREGLSRTIRYFAS